MRTKGISLAIGVTMLMGNYACANSFVGFRPHAFDLTYPGAIGAAGVVSADLDGDGIEDLVSANRSASDLVVVFGRRPLDGDLRTKQVLSYAPMTVTAISAVPGGSDRKLVVIRNDGQADVYGNWPLEVVDTIVIPVHAIGGTVRDVDADSSLELAVATAYGLKVYDLQSHTEELDITASAINGMTVAQLDEDAQLELVANGFDKLRLFDGASGSFQADSGGWVSYLFAVGQLGVGGTDQIAAAYGPDVDVFGGSPFGFQWNWHTDWSNIGRIHAADLDGNGRDELLLGDGSERRVIVLDAATHLERLAFPTPDLYDFGALISLDIDGDGHLDLVATPGYPDSVSGYDGTILRTSTGEPIHTWTSSLQSIAVVALADVDGDGQIELLAGEGESSFFGRFFIIDAVSGNTEWATDSESFRMAHSSIAIGNIDVDPNQEILLGGMERIVVLDGVTRQVDLDIWGQYDLQLRFRAVGGLSLLDVSSDGQADIVAATFASSTGSSKARLQAFSTQNGAEVWSSTPIGNDDWAETYDLVQAQTDADAAVELIAFASDTVQAFDAVTHAVDWTLSVNNNGGLFDPSGVSGAEIVTFSNAGDIAVYDAMTRAPLRGFSVPGRLERLARLEPDGNVPRLLALFDNKLAVISGVDGTVLFQSESLGAGPPAGKPAATLSTGNRHWVAAARDYGWQLLRLGNLDAIYANDFE